jgi:predicted GIY-YIG superfamily endonuclease
MYFVYIVQCRDGLYYTGVTNDLEKRLNEHNSGLFDGFTSTRLPVTLVYHQSFQFVDDAIRAEKQIKGWSRDKKEALINGDFEGLKLLSKSKSGRERETLRLAQGDNMREDTGDPSTSSE